MVTRHEAVCLWEDTVGDSGLAPTDAELHLFAMAVEEQARKPFIKLHKRFKRVAKENRSYAKNHAGSEFYRELYQDAADQWEHFAKILKNRIEAKN